VGSAADGDQDALLGMVYLAAALKFPADFVDVVDSSRNNYGAITTNYS